VSPRLNFLPIRRMPAPGSREMSHRRSAGTWQIGWRIMTDVIERSDCFGRLIPWVALVVVQGCAAPASRTAVPPVAPSAVPAVSPGPSFSPGPSVSHAPPGPTATPDPRASCLAPLPEHTEPSPCPAAAEPAACRFAEGTEYFRRRDYPAAADRFIALSLEHLGQLGRASAENALFCIVSLARDAQRSDCRTLYRTLAPRIIDRHCPLPQSASNPECHAMHRLHFNVQKASILEDFERSSHKDEARTAAASNQLFERYCVAAGPLNNAHQAPVAAGCDELVSNAYRLFVQLGDAREAERVRAKFLDPANRLAESIYAQDFAAPTSP
jgi:hypothetical protein